MKKYIYLKKKVNEAADPTLASSGMVQGNGYGYVYRILPLNKSLEQKPNDVDDEMIMHVGSMVRGYEIGTGFHNGDTDGSEKIEGKIIEIMRDPHGEGHVIAVKIQPVIGGTWVYIEPEGIEPVIYDKPTDTVKQPVKMFEPSYNMKL